MAFKLIIYSCSCTVKPGVRFREVGEIINRHTSMSGLSVVGIRLALNYSFISLFVVYLHPYFSEYISFR
jgi:hypothetical protein